MHLKCLAHRETEYACRARLLSIELLLLFELGLVEFKLVGIEELWKVGGRNHRVHPVVDLVLAKLKLNTIEVVDG